MLFNALIITSKLGGIRVREVIIRRKSVMPVSELEDKHFIGHDNGWFTGNLVMKGDVPCIVGDFIEFDEEYTINEFWTKVIPESVGQYTGLRDSNYKKIFEGDIGWDAHHEVYGVVKFDEGKFIYCWDNICEDLFEVNEDIEIVGNTYEESYLLNTK